jgi:hypothetical protein
MTVLAMTTTHPARALTQAGQVFPGMGAVAEYLRGQARSEARYPAREHEPGLDDDRLPLRRCDRVLTG